MPTRFRVLGSGSREGWARWRFAWLGVVLVLVWSTASASEEIRVISMAPHLTELAFAAGVGDRLVGVVDWSDYPPEARELPSIGDAFRFDLERIMALNADLALAWRGGTPTRAVDRLADLGVEILWIETRSLEDIGRALEIIGREMGDPEAGQEAARDFRARLTGLASSESPGEPERVFYQVSARPLFTLGGRHVINEVFAHCGLKNIFHDLDIEASVIDFEAVLAERPDMIIASDDGADSDPLALWRDARWFADPPSLHTVAPETLVRPTPRIIEGIRELCDLRY